MTAARGGPSSLTGTPSHPAMLSILPSGFRLALVLAAVTLAVPTVGCQSLTSGLRVPPNETFVLGGDGPAFSVRATNIGSVAVALVERAANGKETPRGTLAPGATAQARFARGSAALVVNATGREARVDARIQGGDASSLGMRYVPTTP